MELLELYRGAISSYESPSPADWQKIAGNSQIKVSLLDTEFPPTINVELTINAPMKFVEYYLDPEYWSETQHIQDPFFANWELMHDLGHVSPPRGSPSPLPVKVRSGDE